MKKTWATINETLNRNRKSNNFTLKFIVNTESITDTKDIANHVNNIFSNIGTNLSSSIKLAFTDYLHNPTDHRFTFSQINEREVLSIINKLKNKLHPEKMEYPINCSSQLNQRFQRQLQLSLISPY